MRCQAVGRYLRPRVRSSSSCVWRAAAGAGWLTELERGGQCRTQVLCGWELDALSSAATLAQTTHAVPSSVVRCGADVTLLLLAASGLLSRLDALSSGGVCGGALRMRLPPTLSFARDRRCRSYLR